MPAAAELGVALANGRGSLVPWPWSTCATLLGVSLVPILVFSALRCASPRFKNCQASGPSIIHQSVSPSVQPSIPASHSTALAVADLPLPIAFSFVQAILSLLFATTFSLPFPPLSNILIYLSAPFVVYRNHRDLARRTSNSFRDILLDSIRSPTALPSCSKTFCTPFQRAQTPSHCVGAAVPPLHHRHVQH